jgi:hypothetical protein
MRWRVWLFYLLMLEPDLLSLLARLQAAEIKMHGIISSLDANNPACARPIARSLSDPWTVQTN